MRKPRPALRIHLIADPCGPSGALTPGKTACGIGFFKTQRYTPGADEYEATNSLGGVHAVREMEFYPDPRRSCQKCIKKWGADEAA